MTEGRTPIASLLDLSGRSAIVTGAGVGIGHGIASRLAEAGASVTVGDVSKERAEEGAKAIANQGRRAQPFAGDVSKRQDVEAMVATAVDSYGGVDILVNNAGIYPTSLLMEMDDELFDNVLDVNLRGVYLCTKVVASRMIDQGRGGRIVNITSIDALHPSSPGLAHYDASKHGVWGFTKNVALELAAHRIWVNAVAPGAIATPGVEEGRARVEGVDMDAMVEAFLQRIPMHRMGEPDDIAKVVLFFCSEMSDYMTGAQVVVDGGALLA